MPERMPPESDDKYISIFLREISRYIDEDVKIVSPSSHLRTKAETYLNSYETLRGKRDVDELFISTDQKTIRKVISSAAKPRLVATSITQDKPGIGGVFRNIDRELRLRGYSPMYAEPYGKPVFFSHTPLKYLQKLLPFSPLYSPQYILLYTLDDIPRYIPSYRFISRAKRLIDRSTMTIRDTLIPKMMSYEWIEKIVVFIEDTFMRGRLQELEHSYLRKIDVSHSEKSVVVVQTWLEHGGVEKVMLNLIKGLFAKGYKISLFTTVASSNPWHGEFEDYCQDIIHLPKLLGSRYRFYFHRYIAAYCAKLRPSAVLITNALPGYKAAKEIKAHNPKTRIIDILHTHGTPSDKDAFLRKSIPYIKYLSKRVVISEYLKAYYTSRYPVDPSSIEVIYNGMDDEQMRHTPNTTKGAKKLGLKSNQRALTYIGRLDSDKSPLRLVEIAKSLKEMGHTKDLVLCVCGPGSLDGEMRAKIKEYKLDNIKMIGPVTDPIDILAASSLYILTSDAEGIPMTILEGMKARCIPIMPAVGGIPEMITHKKSGFMVNITGLDEEDKINGFVEAITLAYDLTQKDRDVLISNSDKIFQDKFSHMVDSYQKLIEAD